VILATRGEHRILLHREFDGDWSSLVVRYHVEGEHRRLVVEADVDPRGVDDPAVIEALLKMCDREAQWSAEHPDQVEGWT
jgi:hypothetical protein